ncbi:MAG: ferritin-like domain-containing protein [Magnetospiraceae bacterium]
MTDPIAAAIHVLTTAEPADKVTLTFAYAAGKATPPEGLPSAPPDRPARPARPELLPPSRMPNRGVGDPKAKRGGKIALIHAIAHIELNAIDLAWDAVARFGATLPPDFTADFMAVARDEAKHFALLNDRLADFETAYGDLPAHDGLWEAAEKTAQDPLARMACLPMVLEARGLDTTPGTIRRLRGQGDTETADILATIAEEEVPHVAAGVRWFEALCAERALAPIPTFRRILTETLNITPKPPFNTPARDAAGMARGYYEGN